jgi:hypothetical protein
MDPNQIWLTGTQVANGGTLNNTGGSIATLNGTVGQGGTSPQQAARVQTTGGQQPAYNPNNLVDPEVAGTVDTTYTAEQIAAQQRAAKAGALRGDITRLVNSVKDIFNSRYGQVDASAGEQVGKLNERFANESGDLARQVLDTNDKVNAGAAAGGTFDSSYRGNNNDTVSREGQSQIRDLGTGLQDDIAKIAAWVSQQKAGYDAERTSADQTLAALQQSTDPDELASAKATLESRIAQLQASSADNNTAAQNASALASIAPSNARAVKLQTTLAQIAGGNGDSAQKLAIGQRLIGSAGLSPEDQQRLALAFQSDVSEPKQEQIA